MTPISIKKNSLFMRFLDYFTTKSPDCIVFDDDDGWHYVPNTCEIFSRTLRAIIPATLLFLVGATAVYSIGDFIGLVAYVVMHFSDVLKNGLVEITVFSFVVIVTLFIVSVIGFFYWLGRFVDDCKERRREAKMLAAKKEPSSFMKIIKAVKDKICIPVELVD